MNIQFTDEILTAAPGLQVLLVEADVTNSDTDDALWHELSRLSDSIRSQYAIEQVNKRAGIAATRVAYKALGKEPNRYRPSTEALMRRMVKGLELYRTTALVDLINVLSVECGHSIGGFDADKIEGDTLTLGRGREGEPYEAIGRGKLNIDGLPVFRDAVGGIGTPTSDNDRTKLSHNTTRLVMTINMYGVEMPLDDIKRETVRLLATYAAGRNIRFTLVSATDRRHSISDT